MTTKREIHEKSNIHLQLCESFAILSIKYCVVNIYVVYYHFFLNHTFEFIVRITYIDSDDTFLSIEFQKVSRVKENYFCNTLYK